MREQSKMSKGLLSLGRLARSLSGLTPRRDSLLNLSKEKKKLQDTSRAATTTQQHNSRPAELSRVLDTTSFSLHMAE